MDIYSVAGRERLDRLRETPAAAVKINVIVINRRKCISVHQFIKEDG